MRTERKPAKQDTLLAVAITTENSTAAPNGGQIPQLPRWVLVTQQQEQKCTRGAFEALICNLALRQKSPAALLCVFTEEVLWINNPRTQKRNVTSGARLLV